MYNLQVNGRRVTNLRLSGKTAADIFTNKVAFWDDPEIKADNPQLALPHMQITPVVRSDSDGATAVFTQWMLATNPSKWQAYCAVVGRTPCTPTATYPVQQGTAMIAQSGDPGVATYVASPSSNGSIGYVPYSWALQEGFPVAKVLNAAGYYTAPTPDNVGVSLLGAQLNADGTADLSPVYAGTDPRTYELSYYSYMIVPTDLSNGMSTSKGSTLGVFGQYALCRGQQEVDVLGYAALPINLVEAGFAQLAKIPGASVPTTTAAILASCDNPTFSPDGTNTLANDAPMPAACDRQGATQCTGPPGTVPLTTTVPATGAFTLTVDTTDTVTLTVGGNNATAATTPITVSDTRNTSPGWSVSGQAADFTGNGTAADASISGNQLGWTPTGTSLGTGVTLGGTVAPAAPGLGATAAVLASAPAGTGAGTSKLGADLTLAIPSEAVAGDYTGALTVTAVTALP
jgi:ABC-type phosphate transport system substrate-binding protein